MRTPRFSRRAFLGGLGLGALSLAFEGNAAGSVMTGPARDEVLRLSEHLFVYRGPINVGMIRSGRRALLIDCGDERIVDVLRDQGIETVDRVLFTHHHRDQACGAAALVAAGAAVTVPDAERDAFEGVAAWWAAPESRWHLYHFRPHRLMLTEPLPVAQTVAHGDRIPWGPARIHVLHSPGHTDGSVSYLVECDARRVLFCGDAIYDEGRVWDLHSLQKGFGAGRARVGDYHGFLGARPLLVESLRRLRDARPDLLVPSHGSVMTDPARAVDAIVDRLADAYDEYVAISALRHYFPALFAEYAGRPDHMPAREGLPVPEFLRHFETTWMILSRDRAAFVIDCGGPAAVQAVREAISRDGIRTVEALWVTHYHDDHVNGIPEFQAAFDCPCLTDRHVADVITHPAAWRLPCLSPAAVRVDRATTDGQSWDWHEFRVTAYHFPGQTLYHAGLLVEGRGLRMFFAGDSFTPAGIDDYCTGNRNWLGHGVGFDRCLERLEGLRPTHIFNSHVPYPFDFTPAQYRFMRENLARRERTFGRLVPWDHPNLAMDESWVRCHPYEQEVRAGDPVEVRVVVTNHSARPRPAAARPALPRAWCAAPATRPAALAAWKTIIAPARAEATIPIALPVPPGVAPGRYVVPFDLRFGDLDLPQFTEAVVRIGGGDGSTGPPPR